MSEGPDIHKLILHDPIHPFPLSLLARQLEFLFLGIPTSTVFCLEGEVANHFDPSDPPEGIVPYSRQAFLLDRFLSVPTRRRCTVKSIYQETGLRKRCNMVSCGFRQILRHQRDVHKRDRHYICIVEECMAIFDKVGNATRHADTLHNAAALRRRQTVQLQKRYEIQLFIKSAQRRAIQRRERREAVERRKRVQHTLEEGSLKVAKKTQDEKMEPTIVLHMRLRPSVLHLRSNIRKDSAQQKMHIDVFPSAYTRLHVGDFHFKNIKRGRFQGRVTSILQLEWVAVTGMMDLYYGRRNVKYKFGKSFYSIPETLKDISPAVPTAEGGL